MKGFYLYCVRPRTEFVLLWSKKTGPPPNFGGGVEKTIGGGEVSIIPYEELEAVTSLVDLNEFSSEEIQRKAQEDLNWIKEKAQIHEYVIEQAMRVKPNLTPKQSKPRTTTSCIRSKLATGQVSVIPMKFGTIFKTEESLKECLRNHYEQFRNSLEKLKGKQEWGVKVYLKENIFKKFLEEKNEIILAKKKEIESMPKGVAFFVQKQIDEIVNQEKDKELDRITEEIYENLGQLAFSKNKDKLLEKDFTGKIEEMVLNTFYLIEEKKLAQFQIKVEEFKGKYNPIGIEVEMSGPWPSYHFA